MILGRMVHLLRSEPETFTEEPSAMNDGIDYGPLAGLIGTWRGSEGVDVSPEPEGEVRCPYHETTVFQGAGCVSNAKSQRLAVVRYHLVAQRLSNDEVFHDQVGYWTWDAARGEVAHSIAIPRAVVVLAGGDHGGRPESDGTVRLRVAARLGGEPWGVLQSPFMQEKARTVSFEMELELGPERLAYRQTVGLEIYGRGFDHTDENVLRRQPAAPAHSLSER